MPRGGVAYFMVVCGRTLGAHVQFMDRLHSRIQLYQVDTVEKSDTIIAFVPVVSRMGTDIEAALQKIPKDRPVILVVLHHTYNVNHVAPESRRCVNSDNMIAVDCLFHEDHDGLMRCLRNDEVLKLVTDHLIEMGNSHRTLVAVTYIMYILWIPSLDVEPYRKSIAWMLGLLKIVLIYRDYLKHTVVFSGTRFFPMVFGNTMGSHITFMDGLKSKLNLHTVSTLDDCDIIIAFVSIVSRAGTDIATALQKIPCKYPVILVVLHHTFNEHCVVLDSRYTVDRSDVFTVDCLHHEDIGLLKGERNKVAMNAVITKIKEIRNVKFSMWELMETRNKLILCISFLVNICLVRLILLPNYNYFIVYVSAIFLHICIFFIMTNMGYERLILKTSLVFTIIILICSLFSLLLLKRESGDEKTENNVFPSS